MSDARSCLDTYLELLFQSRMTKTCITCAAQDMYAIAVLDSAPHTRFRTARITERG